MNVLELYHKLGDLLIANPDSKDWFVWVETCCDVQSLENGIVVNGDDLWLTSDPRAGNRRAVELL